MTEQINEEKEIMDKLHNAGKERMKDLIQKEYFIVTDNIAKEIIQSSFKYPKFNTPILKKLLFKLAIADNYEIAKGEYKGDGYMIKWDLDFFTTPSQLKIIFQEYLLDYPNLMIRYEYKEDKTPQCSVMSFLSNLSIGNVLSILKNSTFEWII